MRALIVDDQAATRAVLEQLCYQNGDIEVVGSMGSGVTAIAAARVQRPDVVFIDAELPDMSGFDALQSMVNADSAPAIIMTAHPRHAVQAYELAAADFLPKPVNADRFVKAVARARARIDASERLSAQGVPETLAGTPMPLSPLLLVGERDRRLYFLELQKISYIESDRNYIRMFADGKPYMARDSLKRLSVALRPLGFVRIGRSKLLNLRAVDFIERRESGAFAFSLTSGQCLESTSLFRAEIVRALGMGGLSSFSRLAP